MENSAFKNSILIAITFLISMMLAILPVPQSISWYQPAWVFMVLLFWMIALPHRVGIFAAFIVGLLQDLLMGTILGQHAFVFSLMAYFYMRFHTPIRSLPLWQQGLLVFFSTLLYLLVQYWIMAVADQALATWRYWLPLVTTMLLWPGIRLVLNDYQHRFKLS